MPPIIMQAISLPLMVNLRTVLQQQQRYEGYYAATHCRRLAAATAGVKSQLQALFCCRRDAQQRLVIRGEAQVEVALLCQRCNDCFLEKLSVSYCVSPVLNDQQAKALPSRYDPWLIEQYERADLLSLIEDELLLSLPLAATHPAKGCSAAALSYLNSAPFPAVEGIKQDNPFSVLLSLKAAKS